MGPKRRLGHELARAKAKIYRGVSAEEFAGLHDEVAAAEGRIDAGVTERFAKDANIEEGEARMFAGTESWVLRSRSRSEDRGDVSVIFGGKTGFFLQARGSDVARRRVLVRTMTGVVRVRRASESSVKKDERRMRHPLLKRCRPERNGLRRGVKTDGGAG